jgi:hypothetical protein
MADSELDGLLDRFQDQEDKEAKAKRRQQAERELPQRLRGECERVASFCQDRLLVGPGRTPGEDDLFDQWAWEWRALHKWLARAGLDQRLRALDAGDDLALALALKWLQKAAERGGLDDLARSMKKASDKPKQLRSVLKALRDLPDRLVTSEPKAAATAPPSSSHDQGEATQHPADSTRPTHRRRNGPSKQALAITCLSMHPEWTDAQIAEEVGVNRTTLYKWAAFQKAKERMGKNRERMPKGYKSREGAVEAYRDDDE